MFQKEQRRQTLEGPLQKNWGADIYLDKIKYLRFFFFPNGFLSSGKELLYVQMSVGLSVCLSVGLSVRGKK